MRYNCWATRAANDQAAPTLALDMSSVRRFANHAPTAPQPEREPNMTIRCICSELTAKSPPQVVATLSVTDIWTIDKGLSLFRFDKQHGSQMRH
jgi:hypothetical protein